MGKRLLRPKRSYAFPGNELSTLPLTIEPDYIDSDGHCLPADRLQDVLRAYELSQFIYWLRSPQRTAFRISGWASTICARKMDLIGSEIAEMGLKNRCRRPNAVASRIAFNYWLYF
jgi:hypothetical protein